MKTITIHTQINKPLLFWILAALWLVTPSISAQTQVIPAPNGIRTTNETFLLSQSTRLQVKNLSTGAKKQFENNLSSAGFNLNTSRTATAKIVLNFDKTASIPAEGYSLRIQSNEINITGSTETGIFYGIQTLLQLIDRQTSSVKGVAEWTDAPRFPYRGLHLDCSRHFFSVDFIKKQLDRMAYYKLNHFHWHLTDGPGWRLEIKKYPKLTEIAAWRTHETWKEWWATQPRKYVDMKSGEKRFGGFYTQAQAREIVKYAAERHITVIPEIEMPGHSEEVLAVYPELSCTGTPYTSSEFCIGNEATFSFLENVLKEVMDIFPSEYIHIGGDEADKSHWKKCPKCQARMKAEGLKNEEELQSYLIRRIEKFLIRHNRKLLGWDEILEGGLAPEATVMSWRGESGGIKAAQSGHDVVMTPGEFCYLDSYQSNPDTQPEAIGGFLPLEKVYSYNPIPATLSITEAKHILGVQANLWTEYIPTPKHAEYMLYPRLLALAEVAWTQPKYKNWNDFKRRVSTAIPYLQSKNIYPFLLSEEVMFAHDVDTVNRSITVSLTTERYNTDIRYTLDGTPPTLHSVLYTDIIHVKDSANIAAQLFKEGKAIGKPIVRRFDYHSGIGKKLTYTIPINPYYSAGGESALIDGRMGGLSHGDGRWQGFMTNGMDVTLDLEKVQPIHSVSARFMQSIGPWIYFPKEVVISVSNDNQNFTEIKRIPTAIDKKASGTLFQNFGWNGSNNARYIRLQALPNDVKGGWVFIDEIVVW